MLTCPAVPRCACVCVCVHVSVWFLVFKFKEEKSWFFCSAYMFSTLIN